MDTPVLGIDVGKDTFDAALRHAAKWHSRQFRNTPRGHQDLREWLARWKAGPVHACMEATGTYYLGLATFLHEEGHAVSVVNPAQIKAFGASELRRTKTDKVDSAIVARYCQAMRPSLWTPPRPEEAELQALSRRLEALKEMRTQELNRRQAPGLSQAVAISIQAIIAALDEQIEAIERQLRDHEQDYPALGTQVQLLTSIPGIGETTAITLLAEIGDVTRYGSADQLAAQAGLVPCERRSGTSVRGKARLSKKGSSRLRKALYWPAITALGHNPFIKAFGERQRAVGKPSMVIIAAAMRRLLCQAYGVLKSGKPFDPNHVPLRA